MKYTMGRFNRGLACANSACLVEDEAGADMLPRLACGAMAVVSTWPLRGGSGW